jgi:hypothetical protein
VNPAGASVKGNAASVGCERLMSRNDVRSNVTMSGIESERFMVNLPGSMTNRRAASLHARRI